jgi:hypothetical protein
VEIGDEESKTRTEDFTPRGIASRPRLPQTPPNPTKNAKMKTPLMEELMDAKISSDTVS